MSNDSDIALPSTIPEEIYCQDLTNPILDELLVKKRMKKIMREEDIKETEKLIKELKLKIFVKISDILRGFLNSEEKDFKTYIEKANKNKNNEILKVLMKIDQTIIEKCIEEFRKLKKKDMPS